MRLGVANRRKGQEGDGRESLAPEEPHTQVKEEGGQDLRSIFLAL